MTGILIKAISGFYYVNCGGNVYECKARGNFRKTGISPVVGDTVEFTCTDSTHGIDEAVNKRKKKFPKFKAFAGGTLSGMVEPIGAIITVLLTKIVVPILPYFLSFAAGAMIYVVASELIPEAQADKKSNLVTIGVSIGFVIMMLLDVALG